METCNRHGNDIYKTCNSTLALCTILCIARFVSVMCIEAGVKKVFSNAGDSETGFERVSLRG